RARPSLVGRVRRRRRLHRHRSLDARAEAEAAARGAAVERATMTVIEALAQRCGVATSLRDSRGERAVPRATLETVLGALGVAAHSDARAAESLAELDREKWRAALPPAVVARQDQAVVELRLPSATRLVSWHVQCDDGSTYSGNAAFSSLPLVER